jgi:hypothetical protein
MPKPGFHVVSVAVSGPTAASSRSALPLKHLIYKRPGIEHTYGDRDCIPCGADWQIGLIERGPY